MHREKKTKSVRGIGIRWKLFAFLISFAAFMLAVIWFFQIVMLDRFYRVEKRKELDDISDAIAACLDDTTLEETALSLAADTSTCVRVFRQNENETFVETASVDVRADCVIHHLGQNELSAYYQSALENKGFYTEVREIVPGTERFPSRSSRTRVIVGSDTVLSMVYNKIIVSPKGNTYFLMLCAVLTPVGATVKTLMVQFIWISAALVIGAFLLALLISHNISRPIADMNRAAKELARGHYDADFQGYGYREIRELGDSLNYASGQLSKLDDLQQELISNVSHDLRTPLTMIRGYSEMIRDIPGENTPENMQVIIDETTRLGDLVTDLLDISKIRSGTRTSTPETFNITSTVREVLLRYDKLVRFEGYTILSELDDEVIVNADRPMILQVIYNLINNAINYAGVDKTVLVRQSLSDGKVRISVSDHGNGIAPEDICLIWDRYYKVDAVHKRAVVGTGLGLSIVKGILEMHKAKYGVDSAPGHGSTFWFELDIVKKEDKTDE